MVTEKVCKGCGKLLLKLGRNRERTSYSLVCDDWRCPNFRQPQGSETVEKQPKKIKKEKKGNLGIDRREWLLEELKKAKVGD